MRGLSHIFQTATLLNLETSPGHNDDMLDRTAPLPCDVHLVAGQCGIRILKPSQHGGQGGRRACFCPKTLKRIGQAHGADHLRLVLRLIVESKGNAGALQMETIAAVSALVRSGLVEIRADPFDDVDLGQMRAWAQVVKPMFCSTAEAMATALLWRFASPEKIMPRLSDEEAAAEEKRAEIARKGRQNARKRRLSSKTSFAT